MIKKYLLALLVWLCVHTVIASHIVGGDIRVVQLIPNSGSYRVRLLLLFNELSGHINAEDVDVAIRVFEKGTNRPMEFFVLPKTSNDRFLATSVITCNDDITKTRMIVYENDIVLSPALYNNPDGYYLAWERCCRNVEITNITYPDQAAAVFKTEIPPVQVDGVYTNNSTPLFTSLNADHACVGKRYYFNFSAYDIDGDSLAYALATPLNGFSTIQDPAPGVANPGPYPYIKWEPGYDSVHAVNGPEPLSISKAGYVTGISDTPGLFVYAVVCSEYRNGKKIGECRRDYQVKIIDGCRAVLNPDNKVRDQHMHTYLESDTIIVSSSKNNIIEIFTSDQEYANITYTLFPDSIFNLVSMSKKNGVIEDNRDTLNTFLTWKNCSLGGSYRFAVIATKSACPFPVTDTAWINLKVVPDPNAKPFIYTSISSDSILTIEVAVDSLINFKVWATDTDPADTLVLRGESEGQSIAASGFYFVDKKGTSPLESDFRWKPDCAALKRSKPYRVLFYVQDNSCYAAHQDSVLLTIKIKKPPVITDLNLYNVFTPDGDGLNDVFTFPALPADNCDEAFSSIEIYNRWGTNVFSSTDRGVVWDGGNLTAGVYYYSINYTGTHYKGWVEIIR